MSYCSFENTLKDLRDCADNWGLESDASKYERNAKEEMIDLIIELAKSIKANSMEEDKPEEDEDEDEE